MWVTKAGKAFWNGRDDRGHFDTVDRVAEARFKGEDAPHCQHACCKGRRAHPAGLPVMRARKKAAAKWGTDKTLGKRGRTTAAARAASSSRAASRDYAAYLHGQYLAADKATRGNMVSKAGRRAGYTGSDFFKAGRRPSVEKWGTDELRAWFGSGNAAAHGRGHRVLSRTAWESQQRKAA
jgi:hypothetical protein